ncbi:MAG: hypothetical protein JO026_02745, partial [Patescibacteria group bacterium]|nr:hypothetical protein [Patescibacteria group bacterium]
RNGDTLSPRIMVVSRGENVRFLNVSSLSMRIEADRTASTTVPATYQEAQSVGRNGAYELSFENPGVWVVYNLNDRISPTTAVVYVK